MTPPPPRLAAVGLACAYGERTVLHGFDLAAEPGSVTALLGPNGAGKSTALRALSRLLRPRQGAVTLDGREIWQLPRRRFVAHVAFMPQVETAAGVQRVDRILVVIDAATPEAADNAADALVNELSPRSDLIRTISRFDGDEFFDFFVSVHNRFL